MRIDKQRRKDAALQAFGASIRILRIEQNMTQEELGIAANLHRTYVTDIENGLRNLSLLTLLKVCSALQCKLSKIVQMAEAVEGWPSAGIKGPAL